MAIIRIRDTSKSNMLNQLKTDIDSGGAAATLKIYTGSMPATPETAATGTLLGTLTLSYNPCASITGSGSTHKLTFGAVTQDSAADATGTAGYGRISTSGGTAIFDVDVTATGGGGALQMNTTSIVIGGPISVTLFTLALP